MHCHRLRQLLVDFVDGELDEKTSRELEEHMKDCIPCREFIDTYRATIKVTRKLGSVEMPHELKERLLSFIKQKLGDQGGSS